jgi:hypothetical protein
MLWHFHRIRYIIPVYGNGHHQAPTNFRIFVQWHCDVEDHLDEYVVMDFS